MLSEIVIEAESSHLTWLPFQPCPEKLFQEISQESSDKHQWGNLSHGPSPLPRGRWVDLHDKTLCPSPLKDSDQSGTTLFILLITSLAPPSFLWKPSILCNSSELPSICSMGCCLTHGSFKKNRSSYLFSRILVFQQLFYQISDITMFLLGKNTVRKLWQQLMKNLLHDCPSHCRCSELLVSMTIAWLTVKRWIKGSRS